MIQYPVTFQGISKADSGIKTQWTAESGSYQLACSVPKEFEGDGNGLSPEDLFAQALINCFVATFKVFAHHSKLEFNKIDASGVLTVDRNDAKQPVMKKLSLDVTLSGASDQAKAESVAKKAFQSGFILNSVKTELEFKFRCV